MIKNIKLESMKTVFFLISPLFLKEGQSNDEGSVVNDVGERFINYFILNLYFYKKIGFNKKFYFYFSIIFWKKTGRTMVQ
jgi:hypothetical protein